LSDYSTSLLLQDIKSGLEDNAYVGIARNSEPDDSFGSESDIRDSLSELFKILPNDVLYMTDKNTWEASTTYDVGDLVLNSEYRVYLVVVSGGSTSTEPLGKVYDASNFGDGYQYRYLYTIPHTDYRYISDSYIPIRTYTEFEDRNQDFGDAGHWNDESVDLLNIPTNLYVALDKVIPNPTEQDVYAYGLFSGMETEISTPATDYYYDAATRLTISDDDFNPNRIVPGTILTQKGSGASGTIRNVDGNYIYLTDIVGTFVDDRFCVTESGYTFFCSVEIEPDIDSASGDYEYSKVTTVTTLNSNSKMRVRLVLEA